jgi:serine/threonine protein phosphatase PrpC/predicted Ser/Thr protein kinase
MSTGSWIRSTIGPYRLVEFLGAGGMGEVYRAIDERAQRVVAIKVLTTVRRVPNLVERFRNEARIQAALHHPHIAASYDFVDSDAPPSIVMEYVDGETLEQRSQRRRPMPLPEALALIAPVVDAVGYLHERGIVHRDIKASNVKVSSTGVVKLLDFGIAKGPGSPSLTADGSVIGTLQALAPEQLDGSPAGNRSDIWSLGVLLYELATGRHPFAGDGNGITGRIRAGRYEPPSRVVSGLPTSVDRIVARCLRVNPGDRYHSCEALLTDVRALLEPPSVGAAPATPLVSGEMLNRARSHGPLAAAMLAAVLAVGFLGWSLGAVRPESRPAPPGPVIPVGRSDSNEVAAESLAADVRVVTIYTINGNAEVWRDGAPVGSTPYRLRAPIGAEVSVTLRREGFEDELVRFDVTEGRSEYSIVMRPNGPRSQGPTLPLVFPVLGLAWFTLPWQRRKATPAAGPLTVDLTLPASITTEAWVVIGTATDTGCVREGNEDSIRVVRPPDEIKDGLLAVVCDGMGGHAAGETASRLAVEVVVAGYARNADPGESLAQSVRDANRVVYDAAQQDAALAGMGTTCTAIVLKEGRAWCSHVGDSRCYLLRDGQIFLMTEDHSAVMAMVREGSLTRDDARHHPDKNVISRALGSHRDVEVSSWPRPFVVRPGDRFLLSSDGLHDLLSDNQILELAANLPPYLACERLIDLARENGAPDNVSVILLAIPDGDNPSGSRPTRDLSVVE